ncbi:DUF3592 domain-containing protein [Pseudomaricurvus alcaniphilus]|uniref:DUF3592 domain-containing protein n=1 Tax=Pseudomaricurvus alcaniphilus TaxID=1166482 RepID=UPI00140DFC91|nr:DUF3592 domain-containing protein [Pseudomaricurvus alcaniphilus]NHN40015.1 DUF3592 domain-containing protein [Pseudomaricurvus alcaniphilus]
MNKLRGILIVIGIAILGIAARSYIESMQYSSWQSTPAVLRSVSLQNASSPTVAGASDWGSNIGRASYSYQVGGKEYTGTRIMPLQNVYLPRERVVNLSKGNITISYDPSEPSQSFIFAVTPFSQLVMLVLAGMSAVAVALGLPKLVAFFWGAASEGT